MKSSPSSTSLAAFLLGLSLLSAPRAAFAAEQPPSKPLPPAASARGAASSGAPTPHHWRTIAGLSAGLTAASALYAYGMNRSVAAWGTYGTRYRLDLSHWRMDNNSLPVNFLLHPLAGGGMYAYARANHHSVGVSAAYAVGASFIWESVLEFKEKGSANDQFVTPGAGLPIGEFLHKLGLYFEGRPQLGPAGATAQFLATPGMPLDRWLDGRSRGDLLHLPGSDARAPWHQFDASYTLSQADAGGSHHYAMHEGTVRARLVTLPGYMQKTSLKRWFYGAEFSDFAATTSVSEHGAGISLLADTLLAGFHTQDIQRAPRDARSALGLAWTTGVSIAFRYVDSTAQDYAGLQGLLDLPRPELSQHVPTEAEQLGVFHWPGLAFDSLAASESVSAELRLRAHPDFAGVGAPAFYDWTAANLDEVSKRVTHRQGYVYAWGVSASASAELRLGPMLLDGSVFWARYWSQDGLDKQPQQLTADPHVDALLLDYSAAIAFNPVGSPLSVGLATTARHWQSEIGSYRRDTRVVERGLRVSLRF